MPEQPGCSVRRSSSRVDRTGVRLVFEWSLVDRNGSALRFLRPDYHRQYHDLNHVWRLNHPRCMATEAMHPTRPVLRSRISRTAEPDRVGRPRRHRTSSPASAAVIFISFVLFRCFAGPARIHATEPPPRSIAPYSVNYHQENDGPWLRYNDTTDRYYTHGISLSVTHQPDWAGRLAGTIPFAPPSGNLHSGIGYGVTHRIFTPDGLTEEGVITDDRPYAGYLHLTMALQRGNTRIMDHLQLDIGAFGPIVQAGRIQSEAHRAWGGRDPRGWHNQLKNEPTLQTWVSRSYRLGIALGRDRWGRVRVLSDATGAGPGLQLIPYGELGLGTVFRRIEAGTTVRLGFNLPARFGSPRMGRPHGAVGTVYPGVSLFGIVVAAGRVVGHNGLIEGNTFRDSHGIEATPLVMRLELGAGLAIGVGPWSLEATYLHIGMSPEFDSQTGSHRYGSAMVSLSRPYRHR